mmetsp:Transcript_24832/g.58659  ORF Transcript_24832/g.58659 Transcript_24832/m.58659 type:complete len:245 (-) Transcript_24832:317-1051(-)
MRESRHGEDEMGRDVFDLVSAKVKSSERKSERGLPRNGVHQRPHSSISKAVVRQSEGVERRPHGDSLGENAHTHLLDGVDGEVQLVDGSPRHRLDHRRGPGVGEGVATEVEPAQGREVAYPLRQRGRPLIMHPIVLQEEGLQLRETREHLQQRLSSSHTHVISCRVEFGEVGTSGESVEHRHRALSMQHVARKVQLLQAVQVLQSSTQVLPSCRSHVAASKVQISERGQEWERHSKVVQSLPFH